MSTLRLLTIVKIAAERTVIGDALVKSEENAARTKQTRNVIKACTLNRGGLRGLGLALMAGVLCIVGAAVPGLGGDMCPAGPPGGDPMCQPKFNLNGHDKTPINTCQTNSSSSPCAWADVSVEQQNFLACRLEKTGPIALCYYSGVPGLPELTPSCTFSQDKNAAQCDCYKIKQGRPEGATYSYILITSILNKEIYEETVSKCDLDGSKCLNATNIGDPRYREAPVCKAIQNKTLFPGADLISTFSPILINKKGINMPTVSCPAGGGANLYAGCMTAPCKHTGKIDLSTGLPLVECTCPTYNGPNQVGNPQINAYSCSPTPHVWSSSYSAPNTLPTEP